MLELDTVFVAIGQILGHENIGNGDLSTCAISRFDNELFAARQQENISHQASILIE